jgi:hypothetical protein
MAGKSKESAHAPLMERPDHVVKLYHVTSRALAERIKVEGFHGHGVFDGERPAIGGNWLNDHPEAYSNFGLVVMSIEIPDDELVDQPTQVQHLHDGRPSNDYYVDANILNQHLESVQIES